jgi:hypothetical protein
MHVRDFGSRRVPQSTVYRRTAYRRHKERQCGRLCERAFGVAIENGFYQVRLSPSRPRENK